MLGAVLRGVRIDLHSAHRVADCIGGRRSVRVVSMLGMIMVVRIVRHRELRKGLASYTPRGYIAPMRPDAKSSTLKRLGRIEGQVRGLARMVEGDRYCIDLVTQISAVRAALRRVEEEVLSDHIAHCVDHAIRSGNRREQRKKVAELMDVVRRVER